MRIRLRFERIYGSISRYGETPREAPHGSPIILDDYPLSGERMTIYLGEPVEDLYRTYNVARAGGFTLVKQSVSHEPMTDTEEQEKLQQALIEPLPDNLSRWNWYITIVIERIVEVPETQCDPARWFSIDPSLAIQLENELLQYGSDQAEFIVDHLSTFIPRHFFAIQDEPGRVVFIPEMGPAFRVPKITMGNVTASTSSPIERCNLEEIRGALSKIQNAREIALTPLSPATLLTLVERATASELKGRALEELVAKLFLTVPGLKVMQRVRTATEEIDLVIFNDDTQGFLKSERAIILAECKNWSGKCGRDEFSILEKKAENRRERCSLSFLVSWNGFAITIDKELLRSSRQELVIVPITGDDLKTAVEQNNFFEVIESAWRDAVLM